MTSTIQSPYSSRQVAVWLRGLLTIAWADGHFDDEEQSLISSLTRQELSDNDRSIALEPVSPAELADALGHDAATAENFLRMAVMVALADGTYSSSEDELISQYSQVLGLKTEALDVLRQTLDEPPPEPTVPIAATSSSLIQRSPAPEVHPDLLNPVRDWLDKMEIHDPKMAHFLCKLIPSQCPFERDINLFGRKVAHIPALCKLNPLYEQLVSLRFRALCYLADNCGEDVSSYC